MLQLTPGSIVAVAELFKHKVVQFWNEMGDGKYKEYYPIFHLYWT